MPDWADDLRYAARLMRRSPGFAATAVAALALGIGANSAIFSVMNAVMFRPLPYPDSGRLVTLWETERDRKPRLTTVARWREQARSFEDFGVYDPWEFTLTGDGAPERVRSGLADAALFPVLGIRPRLGRTFAKEEEQPGRDKVVVLSHALWQRRFASAPDIVGRTIRLDGEPTVVVGVLPATARIILPQFPPQVDVWVPPTRSLMFGRRVLSLRVVGRLKPGVSPAAARAEMQAIAARLDQERLASSPPSEVRVLSLTEQISGQVRPALWLLFSAAGCVLLIACANVANLLLARTAARAREFSVRAALGAGRLRLARQVLTESLLVAAAGGALGLLLSLWGAKTLLALTPAGLISRTTEAGMDWRVALFGLCATLAAGLLLGLAPALGAGRLAGAAGFTPWVRGLRLRRALIVGEVALSLMLLAAAGLLIRSFLHLRAVDLGFEPRNLLLASVTLPQARYKEPAQRGEVAKQVLERLQPVAGIDAAAFTSSMPLAATMSFAVTVEIDGRPAEKEPPILAVRAVTPEYFRVLGMALKRGHLPSASDDVVINDALARRFWPPGSADSDPVGRRIRAYRDWWRIAGVVSDVRSSGLKSDPVPEIYIPISANPIPALTLVVRTAAQPLSLLPTIRAAVAAVDPELPLERTGSMEQVLYSATAGPRFQMALIAVFAGLALALAAIGLYGVISFTVVQQTREIGIRMALGAQRAGVRWMVLRRGLVLAAAGVALGLAGTLATGRLLASFLFGVRPADPLTLAAVAVLMLSVAGAASFVPARRATRLDPVAALRHE
ncbi:MAG: ABC transporter permease [Acidobacteria bacterium]|nr:ABC transporter permease [Acidobacteriota bacterium]